MSIRSEEADQALKEREAGILTAIKGSGLATAALAQVEREAVEKFPGIFAREDYIKQRMQCFLNTLTDKIIHL